MVIIYTLGYWKLVLDGVRSGLRRRPIITLLTDFGQKDAYVSSMKGVILGISPEAVVIDISHEVRRHDVRHGAFLLYQAAPYFPDGTIHVVVVDPGVGTARRRVIVEGRRCLFVGPDNGVLSLAVEEEGFFRIVEIKEKEFMLPNPSSTFEGRDVFAPVSAHLALGVEIDEFGPEISSLTSTSFSRPMIGEDSILGEVLHVDRFGNIVTNIRGSQFKAFQGVRGLFKVKIGGTAVVLRLSRTYGDVPTGTPIMVIGSSKFLEISVNRGSASELFKANVGSRIEITRFGNRD